MKSDLFKSFHGRKMDANLNFKSEDVLFRCTLLVVFYIVDDQIDLFFIW